MDPTATLRLIIEALENNQLGMETLELLDALDDWMVKQGFAPKPDHADWRRLLRVIRCLMWHN